jgi:hypothetical protein
MRGKKKLCSPCYKPQGPSAPAGRLRQVAHPPAALFKKKKKPTVKEEKWQQREMPFLSCGALNCNVPYSSISVKGQKRNHTREEHLTLECR